MDIRYLRGYKFVVQDKLYQKEACDVRTQYSTIFPLSSNQNYQSERYIRSKRSLCPNAARQTLSTDLPRMRPHSKWCSQLGAAQDTGPEHGRSPNLGYLPISQSILSALPWHPHRGSGSFSSVSKGNPPDGPIRISVVSHVDRLRCRSALGSELENGQRHRQILPGARLRPTGFKRTTYPGRRRDLHPQRSAVSDRGTGLSQRPCGLCRKRPQGQNAGALLQPAQR